MTKYESKYKELAFYVDGVRKHFVGGFYETTDKDEQKVLDALKDAFKNDKAKQSVKPHAEDPTKGNDNFTQSGPVTEDTPDQTLKQSGPVTEDEPGGTFEQSGPVTSANKAVPAKADNAKPTKAKAPAKK